MNPEMAAHRITAEKVLGKPLPVGVVVHHLDKNRKNDRNNNLVICENTKYHVLLHVRQRAKDAGFELSWRKCTKCKEYDHPDILIFKRVRRGRFCKKTNLRISHRHCESADSYQKTRIITRLDSTKNLLRNGRLDIRTESGLICYRSTIGFFELKCGGGLDFEKVKK